MGRASGRGEDRSKNSPFPREDGRGVPFCAWSTPNTGTRLEAVLSGLTAFRIGSRLGVNHVGGRMSRPSANPCTDAQLQKVRLPKSHSRMLCRLAIHYYLGAGSEYGKGYHHRGSNGFKAY